MTSFLGSYERERRASAGERTAIGRLTGLSEDSMRGTVDLTGETYELPISPGKFLPGGDVSVLVSGGKPRRIMGPASLTVDGLDEVPVPVTALEPLAPRELTPEFVAAVESDRDGLADAQSRLGDAEGLLDAIGAPDGPEGVADALTDYLAIPLDQITVVDNRGADGQVIANLYDAIIVDGLLTSSEIITGDMLADGAVTARAMNVVHVDPDTGYGLRFLPEGFTLLDENQEPLVALRSDQPLTFTVISDGVALASIDRDGNSVFQNVAVNDTLEYRGESIATIMDRVPRGVIGRSILANDVTTDNTLARLGEISFVVQPGRTYRVDVELTALATSAREASARLTWAGYSTAIRTWNLPAQAPTSTQSVSHSGHLVVSSDEIPTDTDGVATIILWGQNRGTASVVFLGANSSYSSGDSFGATLTVEDKGPSVVRESYAGVSPPRSRTKTYSPTWGRTYIPSGSFYAPDGGNDTRVDYAVAYQGVRDSAGSLRSMVGFDRAQIMADLNGAEVEKVEVEFTNRSSWNQTWEARIGLHNAPSRPATFSTVYNSFATPEIRKGATVRIKLPEFLVQGWKNGSYSGFVFYDPDGQNSKTLTGSVAVKSCRIHITYKK